MSDYLIDEFVTLSAGEPFRLFPFGRIVKNGIIRELTRALAEKFKLPHFKPPIKLGSHNDETPAGGHIVGLQVRDDGLYAVPEYTEAGRQALEQGNYRYHSPEIIWEGFIEDSLTGEQIAGPLIVGTALLHMPALGEAAALYGASRVDTHGGVDAMTEATVTIPSDRMFTWFDRLVGRELEGAPESPAPAPQRPQTEDYAARLETLEAEHRARVAEYEARIEQLQAEQSRAARVAHFTAELSETAVSGDDELAQLLAGLADEQATVIVRHFRALSAQIDDTLETDIGAAGSGDEDPFARFDTLVKGHMAEFSVDYNTAVTAVARRHPDLAREVV